MVQRLLTIIMTETTSVTSALSPTFEVVARRQRIQTRINGKFRNTAFLLQPLYSVATVKLSNKNKFQEVWNHSKLLKQAFLDAKQLLVMERVNNILENMLKYVEVI